MTTHINWVERRFDFSFPAGLYPEFIERLRGTPARLEERLGALPPAVVAQRDGPDWSMQEHAGHLWDLDELVQQRLDDYAAGAPVLHAADMTNARTWQRRHNEQPPARVLACFRQERARLVARLEALPPAAFSQSALHPRLQQPMRLADMLFFQAEHDDYHLARITDLIRKLAGG